MVNRLRILQVVAAACVSACASHRELPDPRHAGDTGPAALFAHGGDTIIAGQTCVFVRSDGTDPMFYVIQSADDVVDEIAKVSPMAASALLNFVANGGIAPPVEMHAGQIGFARMPTRRSVAAKAARDWDVARSAQRELAPETGALVDYRSERTEAGVVLTLRPSLVDESGARIAPAMPAIEVRLVPSQREPIPVQHLSDRVAEVLSIAGFRELNH